MHELTAENVVEYLRARGRIGAGPAWAEELTGGVSNVVLRVWGATSPPNPISASERGDRQVIACAEGSAHRTHLTEPIKGDGHLASAEAMLLRSPLSASERGLGGEVAPFILKQSRPRLRTKQEWFSDVARIRREEEAQRLLADALPGRVPRVLFSEPDDYAYAMEHAPQDARPWKQVLLEGTLDPATARTAGELLRGVHAVQVPESFGERTVFRQLRIDPFYRQIQTAHPDLAPAITPLIDAMEAASLGLCHGDFSPKNLLVDPGLMLVDHETCHLGEPAMDVGFFCSHLLLKGLRTPALAPRFAHLIREALAGYGDEAVIQRALPHLGVCVLARIDGTSPVDYLPEGWQKEAARAVGRMILQGRAASWDAALGAALAETAVRTC